MKIDKKYLITYLLFFVSLFLVGRSMFIRIKNPELTETQVFFKMLFIDVKNEE